MDRYPLTWPAGWRRTPAESRKYGHFKRDHHSLSIWDGIGRVRQELIRLGVPPDTMLISTNVEIRKSDGLPRSDRAEPKDPGVAVYWTATVRKKEVQKVMAVDLYTRTADNLAAVAATLEAMRAIERHGGAMILDRVFTGFEALPAPNIWWHVLQVSETATLDDVRAAFLHLSKVRHPDQGGTDGGMAELNWAYKTAQEEIKNR